MKKRKRLFRNLFLMGFMVMSTMSGCRQLSEGGNAKTEEITVTVKTDSYVKKAPDNFKLPKHSELGFTDLKGEIHGLEFNEGYELSDIRLDKEDGQPITDSKKHKFDKDTTIFLVSKSNIPVLKKLTVGGETVEGSNITSEMEFHVSDAAVEVEVSAKTEPSGAKITFVPDLPDGKLKLKTKETVLKITVGEDSKTRSYTVKVIKTTNPKNLIDDITISAGNKLGKRYEISEEEKEKLFANKNLTIELAGPEVSIILASMTKTWTSFKVNGNPCNFNPVPEYGLASAGFADIQLPKKGETLGIKIEVTDASLAVELNFKIKRLDETVDIPAKKLIIGDDNVIREALIFENLADGSKPEFIGFEPTHVEVQCPEDVMKSVKIDGVACEIKTKKNEYGQDIWYAQCSVTGVQPSGKEISVVMEPKDTENYHTLTWNFKLAYMAATPINIDYFINGKGSVDLDNSFVEGIRNNTNPLLSIDSNILNIKLICLAQVESINIDNETIIGDDLTKIGDNYVLLRSIALDSNEKQISITVNPHDKGRYSVANLKFKAKGNGNKANMHPLFYEISGNKNLPKEAFLDKLTTGEKPVYSAFGDSADIVIDIKEYEYEFLCNEVKINESKVPIEIITSFLGNAYKIRKSIPVTETPTDVKIEFVAKDGMANNLIWEFKVKSGGKKPSIPTGFIVPFTINGIGNIGLEKLPTGFTDHLTDGTYPLHIFEGKGATVEVGSFSNSTIEKVIFKMDGEQKEEIIPSKKKYYYTSVYKFDISDANEHPIEIIIKSKKPEYSDLTYAFKLRWSGKKDPIPLIFNLNEIIKENGHEETLNSETAVLLVQAQNDTMQSVRIGEKGVDEQDCIIEKKKGYWQAKRTIDLPTDGSIKTFVIRVIPKDTEIYEETVCEYNLAGTKISENNAEFIYRGDEPKLIENFEWLDPSFSDDQYLNGYGATSVVLEAHTISPRAYVKYRIVDIDDNPIDGQQEKIMVNNKGVHISEKIEFFADKPTKLKVWVLAEDQSTIDNKKGVWEKIYNNIPLLWSYENKIKGEEYENKAYNLIEIEKAQVKENKIYLVFKTFSEDLGYSVDNTGHPNYQSNFEKLESSSETNMVYYKTEIDVSSLLATSSSTSVLEAVLKMKRKSIDCLTYKVKIKIK